MRYFTLLCLFCVACAAGTANEDRFISSPDGRKEREAGLFGKHALELRTSCRTA